MTSRFYYCLTAPKENALLNTENEFGIILATAQGPFSLWNRYAPIDNQNGIIWLIEQLADRASLIPTDTAITKELLKHIWLNLYDKNVGYVDVVHPRWEFPSKPFSGNDYTEMKHELGNSIWSIYIDTKDRYETLINMYNSELDHLLDSVGTTTTGNGSTRFNDTPQNASTPGGGYATDDYSTNVTTSNNTVTVTSDVNTKMARIDEIQRLLKDLYADWAVEFNRLILED